MNDGSHDLANDLANDQVIPNLFGELRYRYANNRAA